LLVGVTYAYDGVRNKGICMCSGVDMIYRRTIANIERCQGSEPHGLFADGRSSEDEIERAVSGARCTCTVDGNQS